MSDGKTKVKDAEACPRCQGPMPEHHGGAGSRVTEDRSVEVCSLCGFDEGVHEVVPMEDWPVDRPAMVERCGEDSERMIAADRVKPGEPKDTGPESA